LARLRGWGVKRERIGVVGRVSGRERSGGWCGDVGRVDKRVVRSV
jgi:hypothetical protein